MKPVDPRLLRYARATRAFLLASVALGLAGAALTVAQAMLLVEVVVRAFPHGEIAYPALGLLAATAAGRAVIAWLTELAAHRTSAAVKSELRLRLLRHATAPGAGTVRTGELATLATRGIDALDDYFARYLPQLGLAVVVPPVILARIVTADWIAALTIAVTLPLIPLFMALIGWATQARTDRQWLLLSRLSHHFLDVVAGLPTLKVFGRAKAQAENIRALTADYRRATLRTLRIAFLSSFALELLATLSVALVAVGIGMRLVHGDLDLATGLLVLVLAPEAYLPLRQVGTHYHAAAEGLAAADQVFRTLEAPLPPTGTAPAPRRPVLALDRVAVRHPGRDTDSLPPTTLTLTPGETVALVGPSGAGKSTLLHTALGLIRPTTGRVLLDGADLTGIDPAGWHAQLIWVPQHPHLVAGTIADNVRLPRPSATDAEVARALAAASAAELDPGLELGEQGAGLSAGQRRRVALARAFLADRPYVLLDEPTAALDNETEAALVDSLRTLAEGRTVLLIAHRPALLALADRVVRLPAPAEPEAAGGGAAGHVVPGGGVPPGPGRGAVGSAVVQPAATAGRRPEGAAAAVPARAGDPAATPAGCEAAASGTTGVPTDRAGGAPPEPANAGAREPAAPEPGDLEPGDTGRGPHGRRAPDAALARVRALARPLRARFALALLLGTLALGSAVGLMATSGWLISRASQQPPVLYLMVAVTATRAFGIGRAVFRYAERLVAHDAALRLLAGLRVAVHRRLERLAPAGLRHTRRGDLLSRLVADVDALQDYLLRWLLPVATAAAVSLAAVGLTTALLPAAGLALALGLAAAGIAVPALTAALSGRTERRLAPARGALATRTVDLLGGTGELTVAGALPARLDAVRDADAELTRLAARTASRTGLAAGLNALVTGVTVTAAGGAGAAAVAAGRLDGVLLAVVVLTPLAAFEAVTGLPQAAQHRQRTRRSAQRVYEILDAPAPVREPGPGAAAPLPVPAPDRAGEPGRQPGVPGPEPRVTVELAGITARYPGAPRPALTAFDLTLTPGRRVAVVGTSGSGKTTLAQVLLRFLDPASGSYHLAAAGRRTDATAADPDAVRRLVGLCAQDAHLFDSSLRENLRLARPGAGDAELHAALAAARLDAWVATLPHGLDTLVGEHGCRLSGGQRQRLALARALLADFPVLLLDEPAEHLDAPTADALTADLLAAAGDRTTVLVTHRLQGLTDVDEVLVLDGGRTVERGPFARLAATPDGPFRRLLDRERAADALAVGRETTGHGGAGRGGEAGPSGPAVLSAGHGGTGASGVPGSSAPSAPSAGAAAVPGGRR
ncbi:thiol reductant ABC exporter subunit CydD [Streptomyces sp. JJ36]|uniref:thiol reductant ABC exporter subunit CydD n=1 Tax=Streptomyces sp. JJ36 TaxID=2736645 RepID=UPI001F017A0E|nr:thiol reductant ABC exporter subunit CydD [Streptomyces sp. JJ36]MCF6522148.1 thiol reductant ABC exporter subunit CydD [Streptomyces sp. JJ36]